MINKILILLSTLFILVGAVGAKEKVVGKRMFFLCISSAGATALSFVQMTAYGLMGGVFQILFRSISLLFLIVLLCSICKKNSITEISDMRGIGRDMPYAFLTLVIFSMIVIGMPMTGTFSGILYSEIGLLGDEFGVFIYIGMLGNMLGIIVPALLLFPILKLLYFPGEGVLKKQAIVKPERGMVIFNLFAAMVLIVLCIYQKPVLTIAQKLMESILD